MPFNVKITYEGNNSMMKIADEFRNKLSEKEILKTAAFTVNITARRIISQIKRDVKKDYTISNKYLDRSAKLSKPASGSINGLYAKIGYSVGTIPIIGFKTNKITRNKQNDGVIVEIKKGKQQLLKHAFIAKMRSGHIGVFAIGSYVSGKFIYKRELTASNKQRITEMKTASPFTMYTSKIMDERIIKASEQMPERFRALLEQKVNKLK